MDQLAIAPKVLNPLELYVVVKKLLSLMTTKQLLQFREVNTTWNLAALSVLNHRHVRVGIDFDWKPEPGMVDFMEFQRSRRELPATGQLKYNGMHVSCGRHQTCTMLITGLSERLLDTVRTLELRYISSADCNAWLKFALRNLPNLEKLNMSEFSVHVHTPVLNGLNVDDIGEDWHSNLTTFGVTFVRRDDDHEIFNWDFIKFCPKLDDLQIHYKIQQHVRESLDSLNQLLPKGKCFRFLYIIDMHNSTLDNSHLTMSSIHTFLNQFPVSHFALNLNTSLSAVSEFQNRLWPSPSKIKSIWWTAEVKNWDTPENAVLRFLRSFGPALDTLENVRLAFNLLFSLKPESLPATDVCQYVKPGPKVKFLELILRDRHNVQYGSAAFLPPPECVYWLAQNLPKVFPNLQRASLSLIDSKEVKWFFAAMAQIPSIELVCIHKQHIQRMNKFLDNEVLFGFDEKGVRNKESTYKGLLALPNLQTLYLYDAFAELNVHSVNLGLAMIPKLKKLYVQLRSTTWNTVKSSCFWPSFSHDVKIIYIPPRPACHSPPNSFYIVRETLSEAGTSVI